MKNYQIKKSNKFKTNYLTIRYVIPATKENATYSSLLSMYLMHANNVDRTYRESTNKLDLLYGSKIDINTALKGNEIVFDFIFSAVSMRYIKNDENYGKEVIDTLITYIKDPLINDGAFDVETFNLKKYELQKRIEGSYDDKTTYALEQFYHIFGNNYPLEVNVLGYLDILKDITKENLKDFYDKLIVQTPLISGLVDEVDYENINNILKHSFKEADFSEKLTFYNLESDKVEEVIQPQEIVQSKLVLGYYSNLKLDKKVFYEGLLFNALFGMSSNSYLFKKVREEANLCYTIRANYDFYSNSIFVFSGIDKEDYQESVSLIDSILKDMQEGKISDEDIVEAKIVMVDIISKTSDSQGALTGFYINRLMQGFPTDLNDDIKNINSVSKEEIIAFAKSIELKTKYLLSGDINE